MAGTEFAARRPSTPPTSRARTEGRAAAGGSGRDSARRAAGAAALLGVAALAGLERRRALRRRTEPRAVRRARNLAIVGASAAATQLAERPVTASLARTVVS